MFTIGRLRRFGGSELKGKRVFMDPEGWWIWG